MSSSSTSISSDAVAARLARVERAYHGGDHATGPTVAAVEVGLGERQVQASVGAVEDTKVCAFSLPLLFFLVAAVIVMLPAHGSNPLSPILAHTPHPSFPFHLLSLLLFSPLDLFPLHASTARA